MKNLLPLLLLLSLPTLSSAQSDEELFHKFAITIRPLGFFDPFTTNFTGSVMFRAADHLVVEAQAGLIQTWYDMYDDNGNDNNDINKTGFRVAGELKYMFTKRLYVGGQVFYNDFVKTTHEDVWRFNQTYLEEMDIDRHVQVFGAHVKFGVMVYRTGQRFFMDFYSGIGFRNRKVTIKNLPADAEITEQDDNWNPFFINDSAENESRTYPTITLGFSMGLRIGK